MASIGSLTEKISTYVDSLLKPHVCSLPSYVRDSMDMINILKNMDYVDGEVIMVTCIPHEDGLQALTYFLNKRVPQSLPSTNCVTQLAELILTRNLF